MSIGAKDYGLIGYNVISDLVDMTDLDGNIKIDEKPWNSSKWSPVRFWSILIDFNKKK